MKDPNFTHRFSITDIQHDFVRLNLKNEISNGLKLQPKELPSLLLWDNKGLALFEKVRASASIEYYPSKKETEVITQYAQEIAQQIQKNAVVIELGSGNTQKTSLVLSALQRQQKSISYYALDVSCAELTRNLHDLTQHFSPANLIKCHGLLGTYEDGISWLKSHLDCSWISVTIVWLGNSIGNLTRSEASGFLARVRSCTNMVNLQFIIGIDGCRDEGQIEQCYNPANPATQNFLLNGLDRANNVLGGPCFQLQHWTCKGSYDKQQRVWQQHYVAEKSMQFKVADSHVRIDKGEKILAIRTAKWIEDDVNLISENAGLEISRVWKTKEKSYGVYLLRPSLNNGDDC